MVSKTGGPAFPVPMFSIGPAMHEAQQQGLSLRDYFAAKAMQAFCDKYVHDNSGKIADVAYTLADAMLKARSE